jgi:hypothetical protein
MDCQCGKVMFLVIKSQENEKLLLGRLKLWACPPEGCGRVFLEGNTDAVGSWYTAEGNDRRNIIE